jgi:PAS domain-containing protein
LKTVKILGMKNAKIQTSKSTYTTETSASPYAENAGAKSRKTMLNGKNSFSIIAPEGHEKASTVLKELLEKWYPKIQEFSVVTHGGANKVIEMSLGVMKDADGKPMGLVDISRDIPERKKTK